MPGPGMQSELAENAAKVAEIQSGLALLVMVGTMGKTSSKKLATQERYLKDEAPRTCYEDECLVSFGALHDMHVVVLGTRLQMQRGADDATVPDLCSTMANEQLG